MINRVTASGPSSPIFQISVVAALIGFGVYFDREAALVARPEAVAALDADLARHRAAPEVQQVARWAVDSLDHGGLPFVVVDKARARLFAFDPRGRFRGSAPIVLGGSHHDGSESPALAAGRFVADTSLSAHGEGIVWVQAGGALSLHGVPSTTLQAQRIPDGSLHVAADFYREHLKPLRTRGSIAYVLPEGTSWQQLFGITGPQDGPQITYAQVRAPAPRRPS